MGRCKARLELDGTPLPLRLAHALEPWVSQVYLVAKRSQELDDLGLPLLLDDGDERALVHGLATVLRAPGPEWRFVCATDMPDVGPAMLARLWQAACQKGATGSYPVRHAGEVPEPLPSLWRVPVAISDAWGMAARDWLLHAGLAPCRLSLEEERMLVHLNETAQWRTFVEERQRRSSP
jgi:molybdopterin-guanine dinucleotide biosynthesis protein A